jgi:acyl-CoA synthetase (AMP-forming)/AMP-acid ligase II/aryl carrier-like protein
MIDRRTRTAAPVGTIHAMIRDRARQSPDAVAIATLRGVELTYNDLVSQVDQVIAVLRDRGIGPADRVAIVLPNGAALAVMFVAVASAAVCAPLNPQLRPRELEIALVDLRVRALIVSSDEAGRRAATTASALGVDVIQLQSDAVHLDGWLPAAQRHAARRTAVTDTDSDVALVLQTSGTTARPKVVPLTHVNLLTSAANIAATLHLTPDDRCLVVMPLFHIHGLVGALLSSLSIGGSVVCAGDFAADTFCDALNASAATWYTAVPTIHAAVLAQITRAGRAIDRRLRFIRSSSAPLAPSLIARLEDQLDTPVIESYGMTEAAHQMASNPIPPGVRKPGSVGVPAGPEIAILDEAGEPVRTGDVGEIAVRGPSVTAGYDGAPGENANAFFNGWFRTGDLGRFDEDGYLYVAGRLKEIINRGGEKISPREVDEVLVAHDAVGQAVTFAISHPTLGEDVAAAVVLKPGATADDAELRRFARARLADPKVPQAIIFVDDLPKGPSGKLQRVGLADVFRDRLHATFVTPRTDLERTLASLWADVLAIDAIGVHDNFFAAGGDSLQVVLLAARSAQAGVPLAAAEIFRHPTVAMCAALVAAHTGTRAPAIASDAAPPRDEAFVDEAGIEAVYAMLPHQRLLWDAQRRPEVARELLFCTSWTIDGPLDVAAFETAWRECAQRHPVLRTTLTVSVEGEPVQVVHADAVLDWETCDLSEFVDAERAERLDQFVASALDSGMDASRQPLFRLRLARIDARRHRFVCVWHHAIMDLWLALMVMREVVAQYDASENGLDWQPPATRPFREYVEWVARQPRTGEAADFWRRHLSREENGRWIAPAIDLPARWARSDRQPRRRSRERCTIKRRLSADLFARAAAFARRETITLGTLVYGAWIQVQGRYQESSSVSLMTTVSGRWADLDGVDTMIGPLFSTQPFRASTTSALSQRDWLRALQRDHADVQRFDFVSASDIERWVGAPLAGIWCVLILQNLPAPLWRLRSRSLTFSDLDIDVWLRRPLAVFFFPRAADGLEIQLIHDPALIPSGEADEMLSDFAATVERIVSA